MPFLSTLSVRRATERINIPHKRKDFLSTLSVRRATKVRKNYMADFRISIHALREESDLGYRQL